MFKSGSIKKKKRTDTSPWEVKIWNQECWWTCQYLCESAVFQGHLWKAFRLSGRVPKDKMKENITLTFKRGIKEDLSSLVKLISIPETEVEKIILETSKTMKNKKWLGVNQYHVVSKYETYMLTWKTLTMKNLACCMKGYFSKASITVYYNVTFEKLMKYKPSAQWGKLKTSCSVAHGVV